MIDKTANVALWFPDICTYMHAHPHTYTRTSAYTQMDEVAVGAAI